MNSSLRLTVSAILLALATEPAFSQDLLLQAQPGEVLIGPSVFDVSIQDINLKPRASAFFTFVPSVDTVQFEVRFVGDLADVQKNVSALVRTIPLPNNDCDLVVTISSDALDVNGDVATLRLSGHVEKWVCVLGIKTKVEDSFDATLPFTLTLADPHTVAVQLGDPSVTLGGPLGFLTDLIRHIAGFDINSKIKEALQGSIQPLRGTLPEDLLPLNPVITNPRFLSNSGALAMSAHMSVSLDSKAIVKLLQILLTTPQHTEG